MDDPKPSHVLVYERPQWGDPEHAQLFRHLFEAATPYADAARFRIDRDLLRDADPALVERVDEGFDRDPHDEERHHTRDLDAVVAVLTAMLERQHALVVLAARLLTLVRDGEPVLGYGPEHRSLEVHEAAAPGVAAAIGAAIEDDPAVLVSREPVLEWEQDGQRYGVGRRIYLRSGDDVVGDRCLPLPDAIETDPDELTIGVEWDDPDSAVRRALRRIAARFGHDRPERFEFDSVADFEAARDAIEGVQAGLDGERGLVE